MYVGGVWPRFLRTLTYSSRSAKKASTAARPSDVAVYIYIGDGGEYRIHPSPVVLTATTDRVVFRNLCDTSVKLDLRAIPLQAGTLTIKPEAAKGVRLAANARPGAYPYGADALVLTKAPQPGAKTHALAIKGNSSPKIIVDT